MVARLPDGSEALYWDNPQIGDIGRETVDGNAGNINQSVVTGIRQLRRIGVGVDSQHVYWSDGPFIGRSNLDGTGVSRQFIQLRGATDFLALDDKFVYWSGEEAIGRANLEGGGVNDTFISLPGVNLGVSLSTPPTSTGPTGPTTPSGARTSTGPASARASSPAWALCRPWRLTVSTSTGRRSMRPVCRPRDRSGARTSTGRARARASSREQPRRAGITVDFDHIYWANYFDCDFQTRPAVRLRWWDDRAREPRRVGGQPELRDGGSGRGARLRPSPEIRCGPTSVAVSAPTRPICMRMALTPAPVSPPGGAVFARPLDPASSDANVVVLPAGTSWGGDGSCPGVTQGADEVMSHPTSIAVAPAAALLLRDQFAGLVSAWGAREVGASDPAPVLFPGRSDWQTTGAQSSRRNSC